MEVFRLTSCSHEAARLMLNLNGKIESSFRMTISKLVRNDVSMTSMVVVAASLTNAALNMLLVSKAARDLGPSRFGPYAAALALGGSISMVIGGFQIAVATTTATNTDAAGESNNSIKPLLMNALVGVGSLLAIIWIFLAPAISDVVGINLTMVLAISIVLPISAAVSVVDGVLFGLGKFKFVQFLSVVNTFLKLVFVYLFLTFHGPVNLLPALVYISALPTIFVAAASARSRNIQLPSLRSMQLWLTNGFILLFWISLQMDILVSNRIFKPDDAGVYASYATIGKAMTSLSLLIGFYLIPRFHKNQDSIEQKRRLNNRAVLASGLVGAVVAFSILWVDVIKDIFGKSYDFDKHLEFIVLVSHIPWCVMVCLVQLKAARTSTKYLASFCLFVSAEYFAFTQVDSVVSLSISMMCFGAIGALLVYLHSFFTWDTNRLGLSDQ